MRWVAMLAAALAVVTAAPGSARGQSADELPAGRIGVSLGVRQGLGALGADFGVGVVGSIEAGYHPTRLDQRVSFGASWAVRRSWFGEDEASIAGVLHLLELDFGGRMRVAQELRAARFVVLGAGASLLRANVPLLSGGSRSHVGPYGSLGFEFYFREPRLGIEQPFLVSVDVRYGVLIGGPDSVSWSLGISLGR